MVLNQEEKDLTTITQHTAGFFKTPYTGLDQGQLLLPGWTRGSLFQAGDPHILHVLALAIFLDAGNLTALFVAAGSCIHPLLSWGLDGAGDTKASSQC